MLEPLQGLEAGRRIQVELLTNIDVRHLHLVSGRECAMAVIVDSFDVIFGEHPSEVQTES